MAVGTRITAEEFLKRAATDRPSELVRGEVVEMNPPGRRHCRICSRVSYLLSAFVEPRGLGDVFTNDLGIVTGRDPDSVRGADVAFFLAGEGTEESDDPGYGRTVPFLIFEVRSPTDRTPAVLAKVSEYLGAGVSVVVVIDPESRSATVFAGDRPERVHDAADVLALPAPLDGLRLTVGEWISRP